MSKQPKEERSEEKEKIMENDSNSASKCYFLSVNLDGIFTIRCIPVWSSTKVQVTKKYQRSSKPIDTYRMVGNDTIAVRLTRSLEWSLKLIDDVISIRST